MDVAKQAKVSAEDTLRAVWGERGFPVDPVAIAHELGVGVFNATLPDSVSGMLRKAKGESAAIYLHAEEAHVRRRFTCAHELGHYMKHVEDDDTELGFVDHRGPSASSGTDPEEIYANTFAANLLMPEPEVRKQHRLGYSALDLSRHFNVSLEAINHRLKKLRML